MLEPNLLSLALLVAVAVAAGLGALLNVGATRAVHASELDAPPQVVNMPLAIGLGLILGGAVAVVLGLAVSPVLAFLGVGIGIVIPTAWRGHNLGQWVTRMEREMGSALAVMIIQIDSGSSNLYSAIEATVDSGNLALLGPLLDRHVLRRVAAGARLETALSELANSRLLQEAEVVQDAMRRIADLAMRNVPLSNLLDALRIMDTTMTEITRIKRTQQAESAQIRYSVYVVAGLAGAMAAVLIFMARDLGNILLYTVPGNVTLLVVAAAITVAIVVVQSATRSRPLHF